MRNPIAFVMDTCAEFCWKKANSALLKSREASTAGDNEASAYWYHKYLKYSRLHDKCVH